MPKIVYLYDPSTRVFKGTYEAQESPLEPGEFIVPVYCTDTPPPALTTGQWAFLDGNNSWIVRGAPTPTEADLLAAEVEEYRMAARQHMSTVARSSPERFNSISEAKSFVGTDNPLAPVSAAFQIWAANVQVAANVTLDAVLAGTDPLPALDDFIASLPAWSHPNGA
jgi:hypothetical protein